ncbi:MAG: PPC domain-containing DNA-binding protein [Bacillus sp. (in: firmicutes)]
MEYKRFGSKVVIRLDAGDEIIASITDVCVKEDISSGIIQGIGATEELRTRIYDKASDTFVFKDLTGSREITSLTGNITMTAEDELFIHTHITTADKEMNITGGHLMSCIVSVTSEIFLDILDGTVNRYPSEGGLFGRLKL